eukprot:scaffold706_cov418-Prasinococcus_capsulatus_cf.AAC.23
MAMSLTRSPSRHVGGCGSVLATLPVLPAPVDAGAPEQAFNLSCAAHITSSISALWIMFLASLATSSSATSSSAFSASGRLLLLRAHYEQNVSVSPLKTSCWALLSPRLGMVLNCQQCVHALAHSYCCLPQATSRTESGTSRANLNRDNAVQHSSRAENGAAQKTHIT